MGSPRAAMALYVALALHLLAALLIAIAPGPQRPPGPGQGMGLGLQLSGVDGVLAQPVPVPEPLTTVANRAEGPNAVDRAPRPSANAKQPVASISAQTAHSEQMRSPASEGGLARGVSERRAVRDESAGRPLNSGGSLHGGGGSERYLARLRQHLHAFRLELSPGTAPGEAEVSFRVSAEGRLESLALLRSSGRAELDAEALDLLRRSQPLPPPPDARALELAVSIRIE